jgi:hypothetical protein
MLHAGPLKVPLGRRDDRVELLEVTALGGDLGGDDDLLLGDRGLAL